MEERALSPPPVDPTAIPGTTTEAAAAATAVDVQPPSSPRPLRPPPKNSNTYVVQVPRDQVYRVPPPENAYLAAQYGRPKQHRGGNRSCCIYFSWLVGIIFAILLVLSICFLVFYFVVMPKTPEFSVDNLVVLPKKSQQSLKPDYEITMKVRNPSVRLDYSYPKGGKALLSHKGADIAKGKLPTFNAKSGDDKAMVFKTSMLSSNVVLPKDMQKGLRNNITSTAKGGTKIPLFLSMDVPVRLQLGALKSWAMDMAVGCDLRVALSSKGSRLLHQQCNAKLMP